MSRMQDFKILWFSQYFLAVGFLDFAKVRYFWGQTLKPPKSLIILSIVVEPGHLSLRVLQKSNSNGCNFSARDWGARLCL